jgi:hypothetical protein
MNETIIKAYTAALGGPVYRVIAVGPAGTADMFLKGGVDALMAEGHVLGMPKRLFPEFIRHARERSRTAEEIREALSPFLGGTLYGIGVRYDLEMLGREGIIDRPVKAVDICDVWRRHNLVATFDAISASVLPGARRWHGGDWIKVCMGALKAIESSYIKA